MKWNKVQLMVHSDGIKNSVSNVSISYPGVKLVKTNNVEGANYLFLDLTISAFGKTRNCKDQTQSQQWATSIM